MNCTRCTTPIEVGDLRCAICALPVPIDPAPVPEHTRAQILRCTWCNAAVAFSPDVQAPRCGFCSSTMAIEHPVDPVEVAERRVQFSVDRDTAERALRAWLGRRGWFAPKTLRDEAALESLVPLCWAGWIVNARATVAWTADSDEGARLSRWAPHSGIVPMTFSTICVPASRGLGLDECRRLVPYYDLRKTVAIGVDASPGFAGARSTPEGSAESIDGGVMIEGFEAQRSAARQHIQYAIEQTAKTRVEPFIPGRRFRNVRVACLLEGQTTDRIALPAWVLAYRFRGTAYRAIVHGQRPEVTFGSWPVDWRKIARLAGSILLAIAAIALVVFLLAGCGSTPVAPDAEDFFDRCEPSGTFAPLTGAAAVQATLNVHVDAGGLIEVDTSSKMLLAMAITQSGTSLQVTATLCHIEIPDIPLAGQELPIVFDVPDATVASVPTVSESAQLGSPDQTCTTLDTAPITLILGARLDPATLATAMLPSADDNAAFVSCSPSVDTSCADATGVDCACDQERDGEPGATLIARNVPAVDLDQVYVSLRTSFSLHGKVHTSDDVRGSIDASLETGILGCRLLDDAPCTIENFRLVRTLNPVITQQLGNPSTFRAARIAPGTTCADVIANEGILFPR